MPHDTTVAIDDVTCRVMSASAMASGGAYPTIVSRWRFIAGVQLAEVSAVAASCGVWLADVVAEAGGIAGRAETLIFGTAVAFVVHCVLRSLGAYDITKILNGWRSCAAVVFAWGLATAPLLFWATQVRPVTRQPEMSYLDWLMGAGAILAIRLAASCTGKLLLRKRWMGHNIAVIGDGAEAQACARAVGCDPCGAGIVGFVSPEANRVVSGGAGLEPEFISRLHRLVHEGEVRDVVVATTDSYRAHIPELVRELRNLPVRVLIWPHSIDVDAAWLATSEYRIGDTSLILVGAPPLDGWDWVLKDIRDRVLAFLLLIFFMPLLIIIAVAIRVSSSGPVLFRQEREGYNGKRFKIFKFRTMHWVPPSNNILVLVARNDSRISAVGAILRRTSLDELPQLFNVLRGDMWLIGPRPHSPLATAAGQRYATAVPHYAARFRVKPGITGWAQVNGYRGSTDTIEQLQQRVAHDIYYIEHLSMWLDAQILLKTAIKGFVNQNAY